MVDDAFEKEWLGELVEVDIADLRDAKAAEGAGEVGDGDGERNEIDLVAGNFPGIKRQTRCCCSRANQKVAPGESRGWFGIKAGHRT